MNQHGNMQESEVIYIMLLNIRNTWKPIWRSTNMKLFTKGRWLHTTKTSTNLYPNYNKAVEWKYIVHKQRREQIMFTWNQDGVNDDNLVFKAANYTRTVWAWFEPYNKSMRFNKEGKMIIKDQWCSRGSHVTMSHKMWPNTPDLY